MAVEVNARWSLPAAMLDRLLSALWDQGFRVLGPTPRDGAIVLSEVRSARDLPAGLTDEQRPGEYRLRPTGEGSLFAYNTGPHAFKRALWAPETPLVTLRRKAHVTGETEGDPKGKANGQGRSFVPDPPPLPQEPLAFLGARACDIAALAVHDRVLAEGPYPDSDYTGRRAGLFVIAVQCGKSVSTCFCTSMQTGPHVTRGFDLSLTELMAPSHRFVVEVGSERGAALLAPLGLSAASQEDIAAGEALLERTARAVAEGAGLDTTGLRERLQAHLQDPAWDEVATRCLGCTSCTMVCPTCFCTTIEDRTDLSGDVAERVRRYDSCFNESFAYVHGGSVRPSLAARYRQWLTHKLSSWVDQFGTSGCVGCGRCVTFCPVGIDIRSEAARVGRTQSDPPGEKGS